MTLARPVWAHLRRYPRWYGLALVWLVAMVALPVVQREVVEARRADPTPTGVAAPAPGSTVAPSTPPPTFGGPVLAPSTPPSSEVVTATTVPAPGPAPDDDALELVDPELLDLVFDAIPPPVAPPLPAELAPLAAAIAPVASSGCTGLGLASVVLAVVSQSAEGVPVERLLPYLAPVVTACAAFPIPEVHTVCAADAPFVLDLGGITSTPPILGLGIDQVAALEALLSGTFGGAAAPRVAEGLRDALDCELVGR